MKKLKQNIRITDADTFSDAVVVLHKEAAIADANLDAIVAKISERSDTLTEAIKRDKIYSGLEEADAVRDEAVRVLGTMLAGYAVVPVEAVSAAAKRLLAVFDKYGIAITREKYDSESSLIESLLGDFAAESLASDIKALMGVEQAVTNLRTAEDDFKAKTAAYVKAGTELSESATAVKKQLVALVNDSLIPYVDAVCVVNNAYANFAKELSARIERANSAVGNASKKSDATAE